MSRSKAILMDASSSSVRISTRLKPLRRRLALRSSRGKTPEIVRERIYERFRKANCAALCSQRLGISPLTCRMLIWPIQVSGPFGSGREEAQRLGRILRPKYDGRVARFFTLVSRDTREEEFAHHRKLLS